LIKKQNVTLASDQEQPGAEQGLLHYEVVQHLENFMVLRIDLISGRKHQIRAQMAAIGLPYSRRYQVWIKTNQPDASIDLHAYSLQFQHPTKQQFIKIVAPFPEDGLWEHVKANP
jgi:23S rRNA pseudouridine1911/1915/1917 synthase